MQSAVLVGLLMYSIRSGNTSSLEKNDFAGKKKYVFMCSNPVQLSSPFLSADSTMKGRRKQAERAVIEAS